VTAGESVSGPAFGPGPTPSAPVRRKRGRRLVRSVAMYGYLGSGNLGNDASFETVMAWLKAQHPEVELRSITIAPEEMQARYGVPSALLSWYRPGPWTPHSAARVGKLFGRVVDVPRAFRLAGTADAVIVPGMGVLEESLGVVPWGLPLWLLLMAVACRIRRRPFVLLDVGAERAVDPITRRLIVAAADLAAHVSYRDGFSADSMRRAGSRANCVVAPDLAFAHDATTVADPEPGLLVVGVMAFYGRQDDPVLGWYVLDRYVAEMAAALARLTDDGWRLVVLGGDRVDSPVARRLAAAVREARPGLPEHAVVVRDPVTFTQVTQEMARAEVVVATRFHNLIAALRLAQPVVSVSYAEKSNRLMHELGLDAYCQNYVELDGDRLVAQVRALTADIGLSRRVRESMRCWSDEVTVLMRGMGAEALGLSSDPLDERGGSPGGSGRVNPPSTSRRTKIAGAPEGEPPPALTPRGPPAGGHGSNSVTGESKPNDRVTPARGSVPGGLVARAHCAPGCAASIPQSPRRAPSGDRDRRAAGHRTQDVTPRRSAPAGLI